MELSDNIQTTLLPIEDKPKALEKPVPPKPDKPKQTFKCLVCGKSWVFIILRFHQFDLAFLASFFFASGSLFCFFSRSFPPCDFIRILCSILDTARKRHYLHITRHIPSIACTAARIGAQRLRTFTSTTKSTSTSGLSSASCVGIRFYAISSLWSTRSRTTSRQRSPR